MGNKLKCHEEAGAEWDPPGFGRTTLLGSAELAWAPLVLCFADCVCVVFLVMFLRASRVFVFAFRDVPPHTCLFACFLQKIDKRHLETKLALPVREDRGALI